jgi:hypothetical protein
VVKGENRNWSSSERTLRVLSPAAGVEDTGSASARYVKRLLASRMSRKIHVRF